MMSIYPVMDRRSIVKWMIGMIGHGWSWSFNYNRFGEAHQNAPVGIPASGPASWLEAFLKSIRICAWLSRPFSPTGQEPQHGAKHCRNSRHWRRFAHLSTLACLPAVCLAIPLSCQNTLVISVILILFFRVWQLSNKRFDNVSYSICIFVSRTRYLALPQIRRTKAGSQTFKKMRSQEVLSNGDLNGTFSTQCPFTPADRLGLYLQSGEGSSKRVPRSLTLERWSCY